MTGLQQHVQPRTQFFYLIGFCYQSNSENKAALTKKEEVRHDAEDAFEIPKPQRAKLMHWYWCIFRELVDLPAGIGIVSRLDHGIECSSGYLIQRQRFTLLHSWSFFVLHKLEFLHVTSINS